MKPLSLLAFGAALCAASSALSAPVREGDQIPPTPETIAISDEGDAGYAVRHFPTRLRLYTFDRDPPGVSVCVDSCASVWPPIRGPVGAKPVGDWTLVPRSDGAPQWAYKGKPVYARYHDQPDAPVGDGSEGQWRLIKNIPKGGTQAAN